MFCKKKFSNKSTIHSRLWLLNCGRNWRAAGGRGTFKEKRKRELRIRDGKGKGSYWGSVYFFLEWLAVFYRIKDEEVLINEWFKGLTAASWWKKNTKYIFVGEVSLKFTRRIVYRPLGAVYINSQIQ